MEINSEIGVRKRKHTKVPRPDFSQWLKRHGPRRKGTKLTQEEIDASVKAKAANKGKPRKSPQPKVKKDPILDRSRDHGILYGGLARYEQDGYYFDMNGTWLKDIVF